MACASRRDLAAILAGVGLAVCVGGEAASADISACALLAARDVLAAVKYPNTAVSIVDQKEDTPEKPDPGYGRTSECRYKMSSVTTEGGGRTTRLEGDFWASLRILESGAKYFSPRSEQSVVPAIGDRAFWYGPSGLRVHVGDMLLEISVKPPVPNKSVSDGQAMSREAAVAIARLVVSRLRKADGAAVRIGSAIETTPMRFKSGGQP